MEMNDNDMSVPIAGQEAFAPSRLRDNIPVSDQEVVDNEAPVQANNSWSRAIVEKDQNLAWANSEQGHEETVPISVADSPPFTQQAGRSNKGQTKAGFVDEENPDWLREPSDKEERNADPSKGYTPPGGLAAPRATSFRIPSKFKGVEQDEQFQDMWYGILFFLHLAVIITLGVMYAHYVDLDVDEGIWTLILCISVCAVSAIGISSVVVGEWQEALYPGLSFKQENVLAQPLLCIPDLVP
jgi:hypothetical protein